LGNALPLLVADIGAFISSDCLRRRINSPRFHNYNIKTGKANGNCVANVAAQGKKKIKN
jgi:hypothetical protein